MSGKDWRDDLALAVAYRMRAMNSKLSVEEATRQVNNFMMYGTTSPTSGAVLDAAYELFKGTFGIFAPAIHAVGRMLVESVQREIANGKAIEEPLSPT